MPREKILVATRILQVVIQGHKHSPIKLLSPEEVQELVPILNMDGVDVQPLIMPFFRL